ncbi:ArsR/SmtB family transcription factor [Rubellimicrobium arenae]|uniref:ArsR/SmtB family transcription factor n=1 Tax=Rubellimicrobium arenae TaxID=2817372 RepID=UPI001B3076E2|nr:metalloregulator ArsR/SmtB family transcription factor [Rubellimicrobium arenae]
MALIDQTLLALADPTRRAILARLAQGEATVMELAAPFRMTQPAISHHLKVLEKAGLIARSREGTRRPCRLTPVGLAPLDAWLSDLRANLERSFARLDDLLAEGDPPEET